MSASSAHKLPCSLEPARLSPAACPCCKGDGVIHYRERDPRTGRIAYEGVEPCEGCDGVAWPGLVYACPGPRSGGGLGPVVRESARVYQLHPPRFPLGLLIATPGALALARRHGVDLFALLRRHRAGDWGAVCDDDALANDLALDPACLARLLSVYDTPGGRLWVITEADRSATTVLLPSEY
ncbi:hypothetical protein [Rubrivirga sp. IMCC43871]|uniref:hypothetical protein n=1 Tax=Rubrivirga sp. IMCC43871 TaxID=3391575 RepID=UPI0039903609